MYADKFHSKTTPPQFNSADSYKHEIAKFEISKTGSKVEKFENMIKKFGLPDLEKLSRKWKMEIK